MVPKYVQEKETALKVKFENQEMKDILLMTDDAKIMKFIVTPETLTYLMNIRKYLKDKKMI